MRNLKILDLSSNLFDSLPENMGELLLVEEIDLSECQFEDLQHAIEQLAQMPELNSVKINLFKATDADMLIQNIRKLVYLNGQEVDREGLAESESAE